MNDTTDYFRAARKQPDGWEYLLEGAWHAPRVPCRWNSPSTSPATPLSSTNAPGEGER
ncbi:hypothetical protein [Geodermatophilus sp. CPCC 205506]|uniref:hypothetical protein n=1 Tax=Geodermatophilus sp. CPCC 205506 TaxID=2936596 RepID=UPI003EEB3D61